jgi:predicted acyl esterase
MFRARHRKISQEEPPYTISEPYHTYEKADAKPLVPGQPARLRFDLLPVSYEIPEDHRLRIAIAGLDKDHFQKIQPAAPDTMRFYYGPKGCSLQLPTMQTNSASTR